MEMWTHDGNGEWTRWSHAGLALDAVARASPRIDHVLVIGSGPDEHEHVLAAIRLTRRLTRGPMTVIAGSEHPSGCWRESVRRAGADRALLVSVPKECGWQKSDPLLDAVEVGDGVCPELHAQQQGTLSVCGRHQDRMVLARHHFVRWCLASKEECPHWQGGARE